MPWKIHGRVQNSDDFYALRNFTEKYNMLAFVEAIGRVG